MTDEGLYHAIFRRKSIRKYDPAPLSDVALARIAGEIRDLPPLFSDIKTEIRVLPASQLRGLIQAKAPHCVAAFSRAKPGHLVNVGFMLETLALRFCADGLGCCWQGWPKPVNELREDRTLPFVIALAFGSAREQIHRESEREFKRKPLDEIRTAVGFDSLIHAARLAPYGTTESWYFTGSGDTIHVHSARQRFFKVAAIEKLYEINAGVAIAHLWLAAVHDGGAVEVTRLEGDAARSPKGYGYVASLRIG